MADFIDTDENGQVQSRVGTETIKCPGCGSNMIFNPETQKLYCEHCDTEIDLVDKGTAKELDLINDIGSFDEWKKDETVVFRCDNCGAKVIMSAGETAKKCPFCGTAHVTKTEELAGIKPNGLVPFAFNGDKAVEYTKAWAKKRIFAPRKFKKNINTENVQGVYTPCFTFDSNTYSTYYGRLGKHYTVTVGSGKDAHTVTKTRWFTVSGVHNDFFDDVLIAAGEKIDQKKMDKLAPYDTNAGKTYQPNYLLGFMAYHYDHDLKECWGTAKAKIDAAIRRTILSGYDYDVVDYLNVSTTHEKVTYKYVMLPVYVGNFNYNKKLFNFFVNGSTGKVTGKTPKSFWRILIAVVLGIAVVAGLAYLGYTLLA